jgi:hypothetical protein
MDPARRFPIPAGWLGDEDMAFAAQRGMGPRPLVLWL